MLAWYHHVLSYLVLRESNTHFYCGGIRWDARLEQVLLSRKHKILFFLTGGQMTQKKMGVTACKAIRIPIWLCMVVDE